VACFLIGNGRLTVAGYGIVFGIIPDNLLPVGKILTVVPDPIEGGLFCLHWHVLLLNLDKIGKRFYFVDFKRNMFTLYRF
jgi:hypothetical protein